LCVMSARTGDDQADQPQAGDVFRLNSTGLPEPACKAAIIQ
jgi:hypothetical protein